jgi:4-amino-4-deoxy-L-arabinose transferase-like glycosyltransferase
MDCRRRRLLAGSALFCAGVMYVYPLALGTPLLDPDEGLHAAVSQEMAESGDFITPRLMGEPFLDKPILYFAVQALSLKCFGMSEAAVRAPGLAFGLLGAITTALVARRLFDGTTALLALLVSLTCVIPLALAQAAAHDVALVPWTNMILLGWWGALHEDSPRRRLSWAALATACVALAVLTKGLIGVAIASVGFGAYAIMLRRRLTATMACVAASVLLGALVASPWYLAMEMRVPGYLHYYLVERHFKGYATGTQLHASKPWHFYLPLLAGGTCPWFIYIVPGVWQVWTNRKRGLPQPGRPTMFVLCWLLGGLAFLSIANSKLITYALPLFPAMSILIGHACKQFISRELSPKLDKAFAWMLGACCLSGCVIPLGLLTGLDQYNHVNSPAVAYAAAALAGLVTALATYLLYRGERAATLAVGSSWYALLFFVVMTWPMQPMAEQLSQRALGRRLAAMPNLPQHVVVLGHRIASLVFYLTPQQRRGLRPSQIAEGDPGPVHQWSSLPTDTLLVVTAREWSRWPNDRLPRAVHDAGTAGEYRLLQAAEKTASVAQKQGASRGR